MPTFSVPPVLTEAAGLAAAEVVAAVDVEAAALAGAAVDAAGLAEAAADAGAEDGGAELGAAAEGAVDTAAVPPHAARTARPAVEANRRRAERRVIDGNAGMRVEPLSFG